MNELDDDLLFELDDVVRLVQLKSSEVTRSGVMEDSLREAHPELDDLIEAERQTKIDHMMMQARHFSTDRTGSFSASTFRDMYEAPGHKSPRLRAKQASSPILTPSPSLNKKKSAGDFMFDMDEDGDDLTPLEFDARKHQHRTPSGGQPSRSPVVDDDQWYDSRGKKLASPTQSVSPSTRHIPVDSPLAKSPSPSLRPIDTNAPWGRSPLSSRLDLKDIMAQASTPQTSALSAAMSAQSQGRQKLPETRPSGSFQSKQSQKERKKTQQELAQQSKAQASLPPPAIPPPIAETKKGSPWQTVQRPKASIKDLTKSPSPSPAPSGSPVISRSITPNLTMRQTVAGSGSVSKQKAPETPVASSRTELPAPVPGQQALANTRKPASPSVQSQSQASASSASPSVIKSIRHTPKPRAEEAIAGFSMADILSQQQAEKDTIREAATSKRSLQEIQQEQEFQQWWDLESRRVMEEERRREIQSQRNERAARGGRGKGRRGRKAGGESNEAGDAKEDGKARKDAAAGNEERPAHRGGRSSGRGSQRGAPRGRGGQGRAVGPTV